MSLESKIDESSVIAENEKKVNNFIAKNLNIDIATQIFGKPENMITKRYQVRPHGHNSKLYKQQFAKYSDIIVEYNKMQEKNYLI